MEKLTFSIQSLQDVRDFFQHLYVAESLNFHPDTPFTEYVDGSGKDTYTPAQAEEREQLLNTCFTVCENHAADIYEIGNDIFSDLTKNWKQL